MLRKILIGLILVVCLVAFFASRRGLSAASQVPDYQKLAARLHEATISDELMLEFIKAGTPALDYLLDDFGRSEFVRQTRKSLRRDYNIGKAMDKDVYATNVVKVAERFGPIGIDRLVKRLPPELVKFYLLDRPEFYELGAGAIKPLLTMNMLQGASKEDLSRVEDWVGTFADKRQLTVLVDGKAVNIEDGVPPFWGGVAAGLVARALWEGGTWLWHRWSESIEGSDGLTSIYRIRKGIPGDYWQDQLSPQERSRLLLRQLNPKDPRLRQPEYEIASQHWIGGAEPTK